MKYLLETDAHFVQRLHEVNTFNVLKSSYDALAGIHDVDAEEAAAEWTPLTCQAVVRNTLFSNQDTPSVTQSPLVI